jgi:hypothetical protein
MALKTPKVECFGRIQMVILHTIKSRAQMDLIDMRQKPDGNYKWILQYVDHYSVFSHFTCTKNRKVSVAQNEIIHVLSDAVTPEVLQFKSRKT